MLNKERNRIKRLIKNYNRSISITTDESKKNAYRRVISDLTDILNEKEQKRMYYNRSKKKWVIY